MSAALVAHGTLAMPVGFAAPGEPYQLERVGGSLYHHFPNAPAVLNAPLAWAFARAGHPILGEQEGYRRGDEAAMLRLSAALTTALTAALGFLLARLLCGGFASLAIATAFAFGTSLLSIASRPYWAHAWGVLLLTAGLWLALSPIGRRATTWVAVATALSWAVFCRPPFAISVIAVGLWLVARRRLPHLTIYVATGLAWLALFTLYSQSVYGQLLPPYFFSEQVASGRWRPEGLLQVPRAAALGTLVSPGRGLFLFTPFLAAVPLLLVRHFRRLPDRSLAVLGAAAITANWLLVASFRNWWGGAGYGPRLLTDSLPWWLVLTALAAAAWERAPARKPALRRLTVAPIAVLVLLSIAIHARGAYSRDTREWGVVRWAPPSVRREIFKQERLWNWRYPQFLAGLVGEPAPRFVSPACGGTEEVELASCGPPFQLRVTGPALDRFSVRINRGRSRGGQIDRRGSGQLRVPKRVQAQGILLVAWSCGSVETVDYDCSEAPRTKP